MRINRRTPRPRWREVVDLHVQHEACLIDAVHGLVPERHLAAWQKGLDWRPRMRGWDLSFEDALDAVKDGIRPLLYGWRDDELRQPGMEIINMGWISVAFLPQNKDLAELMAWGHEQHDAVTHVVNGVVLAYPLHLVEEWINAGCPGPTMKEVIQR